MSRFMPSRPNKAGHRHHICGLVEPLFVARPLSVRGGVGEVGGVSLTGGLDPTWMSVQQQLQGWTEYGPRVCADKARARCRRDIGPTSLRRPPTPS